MASMLRRLFGHKKPPAPAADQDVEPLADQYSVGHQEPAATFVGDVSRMPARPTRTAKAIVAREPTSAGKFNWNMETLTLGALGDDEVVVGIVASGICHTDIVTTSISTGLMGIEYPRVAGHEGSGYVLEKGRNVTKVWINEPVILSLDYCGTCRSCKHGRITHCPKINELNFNATRDRFRTSDDEPVVGSFFGQSSFASVTIVKSNSIVSVGGLVRDAQELGLFAPMGCGLMAGAGTVVNVAKAEKFDRVLIMGLGGVGLAAVMAAKISGCETIIAFDRINSRVQLAMELGAKRGTNCSGSLLEYIQQMTYGDGVSIAIDTTGVPALINLGLEACAPGGKMILVGTPPPDAEIKFHTLSFMQSAKQIISSIEGACIPSQFIPQMIEWYREGKFPISKLVKYYQVDKYEDALNEMHSGEVVKPILLFGS